MGPGDQYSFRRSGLAAAERLKGLFTPKGTCVHPPLSRLLVADFFGGGDLLIVVQLADAVLDAAGELGTVLGTLGAEPLGDAARPGGMRPRPADGRLVPALPASTRSATARRAGSARAVPRRTIAGQRAAFIAYARPATALQRITARVRAHPCLERCGMGCTLGSRTSMLFPFCNGFQGRYKLCVPAMCIKEVLIYCYTTCPGCGSIWEARRASKGRAIGLV